MEKKIIYYAAGAFSLLFIFSFFFISAPGDFLPGTIVKIEPGMSLRSISAVLEKEHVIRSRTAFEFFVIIFGGEKRVISANYYFGSKLPVWQVAKRMKGGKHDMAPVAVTIPEGFDIKQIGDAFAPALTNFNQAEFLRKAQDKEGYLFPDTYFFLSNGTETDVLKSMSENFNKKIAPLLPEIIVSGKKERDIIIMASIIEREAKGGADRGPISGILWKRISIGMPLGVDAAPETYKKRGLPKNPIANPGLEAIEAAIHPQASIYLYYLHDKNGDIHYAKNLAEQSKNILKYLKPVP